MNKWIFFRYLDAVRGVDRGETVFPEFSPNQRMALYREWAGLSPYAPGLTNQTVMGRHQSDYFDMVKEHTQ